MEAKRSSKNSRAESNKRRSKLSEGIVIALIGAVATVLVGFAPMIVQFLQRLPPQPSLTPTEFLTAIPMSDEIFYSKEVPMVRVQAGKFQMGGDDSNAKSDEKPVHPIYLNTYYIDIFEVTNARYEDCVNSGVCNPPIRSDSYTRGSYYGNSQYDEYPVVYIDWNMAKAYCDWRGARLPTEAEWEKAGRSTDLRIYPWGDRLDCKQANYKKCVNGTSKVDAYDSGKSLYGVYNMAGNVWEWVADWYSAAYYKDSPSQNPSGPISGLARVLRGGSWTKPQHDIRVSNRFRSDPDFYNFDIGFRCALSL